MEDSFSMGRAWGEDGSVGDASDGERQIKLHSLTSRFVARFLTGLRPVMVRGPGIGDPCSKGLCYIVSVRK